MIWNAQSLQKAEFEEQKRKQHIAKNEAFLSKLKNSGISNELITLASPKNTNELNYLKKWNSFFDQARKYKDTFGDLNVPYNYTSDGIKLGNWIISSRMKYKRKTLKSWQVAALEGIGIVWSLYDKTWNQYFELARDYFNEHANLLVVYNFEINGKKLGNWIVNQRRKFKKGTLNNEQINLLNSIGMVWNKTEAIWYENFEELKKQSVEYIHKE